MRSDMNIFSLIFFVLLFLLSGYDSDFNEEDYNVGANGEAPKIMALLYSKQFTSSEENYFKSLGSIHAFLIRNNFFPIYKKECLFDVIDITKHYNFPQCMILQEEKGDPPKAYIVVTIDDVFFYQYDRDNRFLYTVNIYSFSGSDQHPDSDVVKFKNNVESELLSFYQSKQNREENGDVTHK